MRVIGYIRVSTQGQVDDSVRLLRAKHNKTFILYINEDHQT